MAFVSRRHFLSGAGALSFTAGIGALSSMTAGKSWAANVSGYKALVCVCLKGGMDQADTILPFDQSSYNELARVREELFEAYDSTSVSSSRNRNNLLKLNPVNPDQVGGRELAMPRELSALHTMFEDGDLALLGNVGPLIEPTSRAQLESNTAILPARLFSHNDQRSTWMAFGVEGERRGWGGLFADAVLASSPSADPAFVSVSATSNDVFLSGDVATPFRVSSNGAARPDLVNQGKYLGFDPADDEARALIREHLAQTEFNHRNIFAQDIQTSAGRAIEASDRLLLARENQEPFATEFGSDNFGQQLKSVAETIKIQSYLNAPRQIFYVSSGGFDTHDNQAGTLGDRHSEIANAIAAFKAAMTEIGQWDNTVVFTMSDFGRTLIGNGDGTDHGWGGHQFIVGGQVNGKRLYGDFPAAEPGSRFYTPSRGRLIPTTAVEQYAASLGRWFGLTNAELAAALPNLGNFDHSDLGFLG